MKLLLKLAIVIIFCTSCSKHFMYDEDCKTITPRISAVEVSYIDFYGDVKSGNIYVLDSVAPYIVNIFNSLKEIKFAINALHPDKHSNDNYSGAFTCRAITGGKEESMHAFGLAIDINPVNNPYIGIDVQKKSITEIIPKNGIFNINRELIRSGKKDRIGIIDDKVVEIFRDNGFQIWGGNWDYPIDYMHFQTSRQLANLLIHMKPEDAKHFFDLNVKYLRNNKSNKIGNDDLSDAIIKGYCLFKNEDCLFILYENKEKFFKYADKLANTKVKKIK